MNNNSFAGELISNLISPVSYFVNHVEQLTKLNHNSKKYKQASIVGISGIGKTQLVRKYAYETRADYNIIWFFDCNLDINVEFTKLAKQLNKILNANLPEDTNISKKEVISYLTQRDKWLLVFDNLKVGENKKVQDLINWEHNGNVIFCSQDSEMLPHVIEMNKFKEQDIIKLADNLLENKDPKDIGFLIEVFDGYPVLTAQAAQLLNKIKGLEREEYKKEIYQSSDKIELNITTAIKELKSSSIELLYKIALLNTQSFSKQLLSIITDSKETLDNNIYQLSKLALISNIDQNEANPIFEMHDVIAQKIKDISGDSNNKKYLDAIVTKLLDHIPKNKVKAHIFRNGKTLGENFEIIIENTQKYDVDINKVMMLNVALLEKYINYHDFYKAEKIINWFNKNDQEGNFKFYLMKDNEKCAYGEYVGLIGAYYQRRCANDLDGLAYYNKSLGILQNLKGCEAIKCNVTCNIAVINALLGNLQESKKNIEIMDKMFNDGLADKGDIIFSHLAKVRLLYIQGEYIEALEQANKAIEVFISDGVLPNDLLLTNTYLYKADALNYLAKYKEAYLQAQQLYNMHKSVKKEDHEVFGRIYIQLARSQLGLGDLDKALDYIMKAITIFLSDEKRNATNADYSEDPDLAASYVVEGDIFLAQDKPKEAIQSYKKAQHIYFYLYKERRNNVAHVSYLYMQGAKAACKAEDLYNYKSFRKPQISEFGINHPNTIAIFEYCKKYDMKLWPADN